MTFIGVISTFSLALAAPLSKHAVVSELFAHHYNMGCIKVVYRRGDAPQFHSAIKNWLKNPLQSTGRTIGSITLEEGDSQLLEELSCFRPLHVLGFEGKGLIDFTKLGIAFDLKKSVWLVFVNTSIQEFFAKADLPFSLELYVAMFRNNSFANIYDVYRAGIDRPVRSNNIGFWTPDDGLDIPHETVYSRRTTGLEGKVLRVAVVENWPRSYLVEKNGEAMWDGIYPTIWKEIEESLNISSVFVKAPYIGSRKNGTWSGAIGMATRKEVDLLICEVTLSARRSEYLDFTRPLFRSRYQIYYQQPGFLLDWWAILTPFPTSLWGAIVLWIGVSSIVAALCYDACRRYGIDDYPRPSYSKLAFVLNAIQALSNQGREVTPRSVSCRILFFSAYLVSAVVVPSYSASLISSLTQKTPYRPFNSLKEMLDLNTYKLLVDQDTADRDFFADTSNKLLATAYQRLIMTVPPEKQINSLENAIPTLCRERKYAFFALDSIMQQRLHRNATPCEILSTTTPVASVALGMAFYKNHDLQFVVNYHLMKMIEFGVLNRVGVYLGPYQLWEKKKNDNKWSELRVEEVFQMFTFLGLFIVISAIIFIFEKCLYIKTPEKRISFSIVKKSY